MASHLEQVWKTTGNKPERLNPPDFPEVLSYIWTWFTELHNARPRTGMGASPITYSEIAAWSSLTRVAPSPWEISVIKQIDGVFLNVSAKG